MSYLSHRPIPLAFTLKAMKCVCKIKTKDENESVCYGTGFFMKVSDELKYLITTYHLINENSIKNITLEIHNHIFFNLKPDGRFIKYFPKPIDITAIEIQESDNIYKDIEFSDYVDDHNNTGYEIYKNADIFTIQYPFGEDATASSGNVIEIYDDMEFTHNMSTDHGSGGCPIILLDNNNNQIKVIGIHQGGDAKGKINYGILISKIINEINKPINK